MTRPVMQAASDMTSDSEGERASKQRFFQQLEADWQVTHSGEPIDYALLNRMHSSSINPESSSSPDKSPVKHSSTEAGQMPMSQCTRPAHCHLNNELHQTRKKIAKQIVPVPS